MNIQIRVDSIDAPRAQAAYAIIREAVPVRPDKPEPLPRGVYTLHELEAIASLYSANHIKLLEAKRDKAARKIKGRRQGDGRRTRQNMDGLRALIRHVAQEERPVTIRQMFYRLASDYLVIEKTETEYNAVLVRLMVEMRRSGQLPFSWVSDSTRWMHKSVRSYRGLGDALRATARAYRRDLWSRAPVYDEVWCEKEALAGVIMDATDPYDVPLMVAKGFSSHSFLYSTAENIRAQGKPAYIYLLGDHDPYGQDALKHTRDRLTEYVGDEVPVHFEVLGVTPEQIERWHLPDRPPKEANSRAKKFRCPWVDLDAIPSPRLRALVTEAIERHVDRRELVSLQATEAKEREALEYIVSALPSLGFGDLGAF